MSLPYHDLQAGSQAALNFCQLAQFFTATGNPQLAQASLNLVSLLLTDMAQPMGPMDPQQGSDSQDDAALLSLFSAAYDFSGMSSFTSNKEAFLLNLLDAVKAHNEDGAPDEEDARVLLDQAMAMYSDPDSEEGPVLPLPSEVVSAFWKYLSDNGLPGHS
jgi:hypothetical protein